MILNLRTVVADGFGLLEVMIVNGLTTGKEAKRLCKCLCEVRVYGVCGMSVD